MVQALKQAGKNPTRQGLMAALTHLNATNPFLFSGTKMVTTATDHYPIDQQSLAQYKDGAWHPFGHIFTYQH